MNQSLRLRIVLENPPAGVDYGLQSGRGSDYETIQTQRSIGKDLQFEFDVRVKEGGNSAETNFLGPFVQGPKGERFVYIDIGTYAGQIGTDWSRRLKIPLKGITAHTIASVMTDVDAVLETRVPGTGKDGGPSCATVKPFPGWHLVRSLRR